MGPAISTIGPTEARHHKDRGSGSSWRFVNNRGISWTISQRRRLSGSQRANAEEARVSGVQ